MKSLVYGESIGCQGESNRKKINIIFHLHNSMSTGHTCELACWPMCCDDGNVAVIFIGIQYNQGFIGPTSIYRIIDVRNIKQY